MKGLIIKDLINISKNFKTVGALLIFYAAIASMSESPDSFIGIFSIIFAMYVLMTYSYDEMARWDSYALTMPLSRDNIVQGKYLTMILLSLLGFLVNNIILFLFNLVTNQENIFEGIEFNAGGAAAIIFFYSIIIPVITKFGVVKARIYLIFIYIVPFALGSLIFKRIKEIYPAPPDKLIAFVETVLKNVYIIVPLILIVFLSISYILSIRIYRKKEF